MSWEWEIAMGVVAVLLFVIAGRLYEAAKALKGLEYTLGKLTELPKLLEQQNYLRSEAKCERSIRGESVWWHA